jgi:hypothetical protein
MFEPKPSTQGRGGRRARRLSVEGDRLLWVVVLGGAMIEKSFFRSAKATSYLLSLAKGGHGTDSANVINASPAATATYCFPSSK